MNTNRSTDRVEITMRTDANLVESERAQYEAAIRAAIEADGVEISEIYFREGSTTITIILAIVAGFGVCFSQILTGFFGELGGRLAKRLLDKNSDTRSDLNQPTTDVALIKNDAFLELPKEESLGTEWSIEAMALARSTETTCQLLVKIFTDLPGEEKSVKIVSLTYNTETQERVEEIYQRKISKR